MGVHATLLGALGDYVFVQWADGRVTLETPAPVTLEKRLAMSTLLATASTQAHMRAPDKEPSGAGGEPNV